VGRGELASLAMSSLVKKALALAAPAPLLAGAAGEAGPADELVVDLS
jgi:hypothetical protein